MIYKLLIYFFFITLFISKWNFIFFKIPIYYPFYFTLFLYGFIYFKKINKSLLIFYSLYCFFVVFILLSYLLNLQFLTLNSEKFYYGLIFYLMNYIPLIFVLNLIFKKSNSIDHTIILKKSIAILCLLSIIEIMISYFTGSLFFSDLNFWFLTSSPNDELLYDAFKLSDVLFFRLSTFFGDPSIAGSVFLLGLVLNFYQQSPFKIYYEILFCTGILLTISSTIIICLIFFYMYNFKKRIKPLIFLTITSILILIYSGIIHILIDLLVFRFSFSNSLSDHLFINLKTIEIIKENLLGLGYKSFAIHYPEIFSSHNSFLQIFLELGIQGFIYSILSLATLFYFACGFKIKNNPQIIFLFLILTASLSHDLLYRFEFFFPLTIIMINNKNRFYETT